MKKILVIGDIMIDKYFFVETKRIAQEAKIPIWDENLYEERFGGAANVAYNLTGISNDFEIYLCGILGDSNIKSTLKILDINCCWCIGRGSMIKTRYVNNNKIIFRHDNFKHFEETDTTFFKSTLEFCLWKNNKFDAIIISDYDKGTINQDIMFLLKKLECPLMIVDSKRKDLRIFNGSNILKLNETEYFSQISNKNYDSFEAFFEYCVVTKGAKGSELKIYDRGMSKRNKYVVHSETFPVEKVEVIDVTGAGDTHTAALTIEMLKSNDIRAAVKYANNIASKVVTKFGTSCP